MASTLWLPAAQHRRRQVAARSPTVLCAAGTTHMARFSHHQRRRSLATRHYEGGLMKGRVYALAMGALALASACGGSEDAGEAEAPESFTVQLAPSATEEQATLEIVTAARSRLIDACATQPMASVRIVHPLASGWMDVPCASVLAGDGPTGAASAALVSDEEAVGEARQPIGPISVWACVIGGAATTLFTRYALCPRGRTERARRNCEDTGLWGTIGISVICALPF
jgi:hypothetical protein